MRSMTVVCLAMIIAGSVLPASSLAGQDAQSRLWDASVAGDTVAISEALAAGARIDSLDTRRSQNGRRALNWAAFNNRGPAVQLLLARGASMNLVNLTGFTPVHHAAEAGAIDALRILIAAGADLTIPNASGNLPIDTARERGHVAAVEVLNAPRKAGN